MSKKAVSHLVTAKAFLIIGILLGIMAATGLVSPGAEAEAGLALKGVTPAQQKARENQRPFIEEVAEEFSVTPEIAASVYHQARKLVDPSQPEWRLVQTPEFMTHIMLSMIHAESRGRPRAIGDQGRARGLTQIWVSTAQQYGPVTAEELLDPDTNIRFSFHHFHYLLKRYHGNLALALYSWNRGEGTVDRLIEYGRTPANGYARKVYRASLANRDDAAGD